MKKVVFILSSIALVACGAPEEVGTTDELKAKKEALVSSRDSISALISEVELQLAALDTNKVYDVVTSKSVEPSMFLHYFDVFGMVEADKSINLYTTASGTVKKIYVKNGQSVKKGQLLLSLDTDIMMSSLAELQTGLEDGLVQKVKTLKEQIELSEIRAPFAGSIDNIFAKEGQLSGPQMPAIRLVNTSGVYVKADVPESYANRVHVGTPASVAFTSMDYEVAAEVLQVGQFIQEGNRTFSINVSLPEANGVKPNQMVHVALQDYRNDEALTVPASLVQQDVEGNDFIYTLKNIEGTNRYQVVKTWVTTGLTFEDQTEIVSGLEAGMLVVEKGSRSVRTGQEVVLG